MRALALLLLCLTSALAWADSEVQTPRVRVVYPGAALRPYAERVARQAERALDVLTPLFGAPEGVITVRLRDNTDVYNAFATPVPHPYLDVPALFPVAGSVGFGAEDEVFLLVLHELTHLAQLGYVALPEGVAAGPRLGLVGEGVARVPPVWFLEGVATWVESEYAGGRRDDAATRGAQLALAVSEAWPSLSEVSVGVLERWPGGAARYLLGVGFVAFLIERHGFDALLAALRRYNAGGVLGTFEDAWREAVGSELATEWEAWRAELQREARVVRGEAERRLTESGWATGGAALSPSGRRLAWVGSPARLMVGDWSESGLENVRPLLLERAPERLSWLDEDTLLYNRRVRRAGSEYLELFQYQLSSARETQLTEGARAHLPSPLPDGCALYLEDSIPAGASLVRWCGGASSTLYRAPPGWHLVGLAASAAGQVALSVWRAGQVDLALLEGGALRFLTEDAATDLEPRWQDEARLLFTSDRGGEGTFEVYRLALGGEPQRLTDTLGGAREGLAAGGALLYRGLSAAGYDLYRTALEPLEALPLPPRAAPPAPAPEPAATFALRPFRVARYDPLASLAPYGWLPSAASLSLAPFGLSFAASLLGQDALGEHSYALTAGYAAGLEGPLGGLYAELSYAYRANGVLTRLVPPFPLGFGAALGLWPYAPHLAPATEVAWGARAWLELTLPLDQWTLYGTLRAGAVRLPSASGWQGEGGLELTLSQLRGDAWGYPTRGQRFALRTLTTPSPTGRSAGVWLEGARYQDLTLLGLGGTLELSARLGYRPSPPVPVALEPWAAVGTAGFRLSLSAPLRYGDGLYSVERVTLEPKLRLWWDGALGLGADLSAYLDALVNYAAPVSLGVSVGYADGFWTRLSLRLPL